MNQVPGTLMKALFVAVMFLLAPLAPVLAIEPVVQTITLEHDIDLITIINTAPIITTRDGVRHTLRHDNKRFVLSTTSNRPPVAGQRPDDILPDGEIAVGAGVIRRAWISAPTTRYDHGVLGDAIEGGAVSAELSDGRTVTLTLPSDSVFEDRMPRLIDMDKDGQDEILLVKTWLAHGAAPIVISLKNNNLEITAAARPIGLSHRWLNPVGAADFDGDGVNEIAAVVTPHIGGTLQLYKMTEDRLVKDLSAYGFSNHQMGSRNLGLSTIADVNGDGIADIIVPDASRNSLLAVSFGGGRFSQLFRLSLPGAITSGLHTTDIDGDGRPEIIFAVDDRSLIVISVRP